MSVVDILQWEVMVRVVMEVCIVGLISTGMGLVLLLFKGFPRILAITNLLEKERYARMALASLWWCARSLPRLRHVHCVHVVLKCTEHSSAHDCSSAARQVATIMCIVAPGLVLQRGCAGTMQCTPACRLWLFWHAAAQEAQRPRQRR